MTRALGDYCGWWFDSDVGRSPPWVTAIMLCHVLRVLIPVLVFRTDSWTTACIVTAMRRED